MKKIIEYINIDENFDDICIQEPIKISNKAEKTIRQIFHSPLYNTFSKYVMNVFRELYLYNENKSNLNEEYNYLLSRKPIIDQFILSTDDIICYSLYNIENIDMNKVSELYNNRYNLSSYFPKNS